MTMMPVIPAAALTFLLASANLQALPTYDPQDPNGQQLTCQPTIVVSGQLLMSGYPLVGQTVKVKGDQVKLFDIGEGCSGGRVALGPGEFEWEFLLPAGSAGVVHDSDTLNPRIELDVPGAYLARLTACPDGCTFESVGASGIPITVEVDPQPVREAAFATVPALPPETRPVLPASARVLTEKTRSTKAERDIKCKLGGGVVDPQWVTVNEFDGPQDYAGADPASDRVHMIEGVVYKSKVSRKDSPRNHEPQDHNFALKPDPVHNYILPLFDDGEGAQNFLEMEWETNVFDANFRPGNGDRVSAFGYLIYDCGHPPFRVEIHPPVGFAVHRNRAIRIPDVPAPENIVNWPGGPVGQNIYVPGIMTEVMINPYGGKMMEGSNGTQLHQPAEFLADANPPRFERGDEITDPSPVGGQVYTFNIYLPRSPKAALEAAGVTGLPEIPLYFKVTNTGQGVLPLEVEPVTEGDVTYLKAIMDFRGQNPDPDIRLQAQVVAAWVYPSLEPDNWGLQRWRLHVDSVLVHDDSDGSLRGFGEWTMWFHANNAQPDSNRHEWTKIIDSGISDHSIVTSPTGERTIISPRLHDFGGRPWSTGDDVAPDRRLGPDLLLFPRQPVQVHASGFEDDTFSSDSLALVDDLKPQSESSHASRNRCKNSNDLDSLVYSGCADYELNYHIEYRGHPPGSALSPAAQTLMDAYNFGEDSGCPGGDDVCGPVTISGDLPEPVQEEPWHPDLLALTPGNPPVAAFDTTLFKPQGIEEYALTEISFADFDRLIEAYRNSDPDEVDHLLSDMRAIIDEKLVTVGPEVLLDVQVLCASLPTRLCKIYFGDLPTPSTLEIPGYRRFTGAGKLPDNDESSFTFSVHCDFLRYPNHFDLRWTNETRHRFQMDLMTTSSCEEAPEPLSTHEGWALGRLDGAPGAMVRWALTDGGEPAGNDTVSITVYDDKNSMVHEVVGPISGGNIQAHEY
jgi:hypothetical protein